MSVPKSKRTESQVQYVTTAGEIYKAVLQYCLKLPTRYSDIVARPLVELANNVYTNTMAANTIHHTTKHEAQMRVDHIILAKNYLFSLQAQLQIAHEIISSNKETKPWMLKTICRIGELIAEENKLLGGVLNKYRQNWKSAPDGSQTLLTEFGNLTDDEIVLLRGTLAAYRSRHDVLSNAPIYSG